MKKHKQNHHHERIADHARDLVAATAHIADGKVAEARHKLSGWLEDAGESVEYIEDKAIGSAKEVDGFIRNKPYQAVGFGVLLGTLLGIYFSRRR